MISPLERSKNLTMEVSQSQPGVHGRVDRQCPVCSDAAKQSTATGVDTDIATRAAVPHVNDG